MPKSRYDILLDVVLLGLAFLSIYNKSIAGALGIPYLALLDEILLMVCILLLTGHWLMASKVKIIYLLVIAFFIYSVIISLIFGYNQDFSDVVIQSLINLKFVLLLLTFLIYFQKKLALVRKFFNVVLFVAILGIALNLVMGTVFNSIFDIPVSVRSNQALRFGGFLNPNQMAYLMAMYIGITLNRAKANTRFLTQTDWLKIAASLAIILLTDSRSAIIGVLFFFVAFYWEYLLKNARMFLSFFIVMVVSLLLFISFSNVISILLINLAGSFSLDSYYIRGIIINMAAQITYLHFPIGTGAATFGTVLSDNSPVYEYFGVAHRSFFLEKRGIYDSAFASILGEYGLVGIIFYGNIIYFLKRFIVRFSSMNKSIMLNALFMAFLFYSLTNPVLTNNIYIFLSIPIFMDFIRPGLNSSGNFLFIPKPKQN